MVRVMHWATPQERTQSGPGAAQAGGSPANTAPSIPRRARVTASTLLERSMRGRVPALIKLKYELMAESPFGYFRGAVPVMAADLAVLPSTGIVSQLCGDAHVRNLGAYAAPDGRLVFDINDFDETIRGPFEWDLKRMAASLVLAGRGSGHKEACRPPGRRKMRRPLRRPDARLRQNAAPRSRPLPGPPPGPGRAGPRSAAEGRARHAAAHAGAAHRASSSADRLVRASPARSAASRKTSPYSPASPARRPLPCWPRSSLTARCSNPSASIFCPSIAP